jgi:hypothetical protein
MSLTVRPGLHLDTQEEMPVTKFVTIGYGDQDGYERIPQPIRDAAHAHDATLLADGALMGVAGHPVQVRNPEAAGIDTRPGPFLRAALPVAGFSIIEAGSIEEAVQLVSRSPCAVAHGVVEVWPLTQST